MTHGSYFGLTDRSFTHDPLPAHKAIRQVYEVGVLATIGHRRVGFIVVSGTFRVFGRRSLHCRLAACLKPRLSFACPLKGAVPTGHTLTVAAVPDDKTEPRRRKANESRGLKRVA